MKKISDFILRWSQKQLDAANLEEKSITKIIEGVYSRILSSIAMNSLPLFPSFKIYRYPAPDAYRN